VAVPYHELAPGYPELIGHAAGVPLAGFPLCVADQATGQSHGFWDHVAPGMRMYVIMQGYTRTSVCAQCVKSETCLGTFIEHLKIHGDAGLRPFEAEASA